MKVTAILKGRIDVNGQQPVQIRVANSTVRKFFPTLIKVRPSEWDSKLHKVKSIHPKASEINQTLKNSIIQQQVDIMNNVNKKVQKVELFAYINTCLNQWDKIREAGTIRQYNSQKEKLKGFVTSIFLHEVNLEFLYNYQTYLYKIGNCTNTVWTAFKFLRTIINKAETEKVISDNPFDKFKIVKYQDPDKTYLSTQEIKKIEELLPEATPEILFAGTWFLIACYTGLRLQDLKAFDKKKNIVQGRLIVKTLKTKEIVGMPVEGKLKKLFEQIDYKPLGISDEYYNRLLKSLMLAAGIKKKVSSHTARHTAAMTMANAGMSQETVAKILGHRDLRSTSTYYKITNLRIDEELKKIPNR